LENQTTLRDSVNHPKMSISLKNKKSMSSMVTNEDIMNFLLGLERRIKKIETDVRRIKHSV